MEEKALEVLYETRHHASRPYAPTYSPQQLNEGARGGILSLLPFPDVSRIKEKWSRYKHPEKVKKWVSLFVSSTGERVAVAVGNQITILQKGDDYKHPCGVFISSTSGWFISGTWSESHDVLGVVDDSDTLYFIKGNGEKMTRITKKHLNVFVPVIGLILPDKDDVSGTCLCTFNILTSDGYFHHIEISSEHSSSLSSIQNPNKRSTLRRNFPDIVFCWDYCPEFSLLAVVGNSAGVSLASSAKTGASHLSLWCKAKNMELRPLFSTQFEGFYTKPEGFVGAVTYPKVLISPDGKFITTLDVKGCLYMFKLDEDRRSLSSFPYAARNQAKSNMSNKVSGPLTDISDFVWWSDQILALAYMSGSITMLDIVSGLLHQKNEDLYSMPVLESGQKFNGQLFLVESILPGDSLRSCYRRDMGSSYLRHLFMDNGLNVPDVAKLRWSLVSFSERSVSEMYNLLISNKKYHAALEFSDAHGLDRDEVFKSQWLQSRQVVSDIDSFLTNIKDQAFILSECVERVGPKEDDVKALIAFGLRITDIYRFSHTKGQENSQIWDFRVGRLKLLQFRDRLETYLGINMGRFSVQEYINFRISPISGAAIALAESGKIGALNLLFKRHPYSLAPSILEILSAIPETVPVQTYGQLLPGQLPPSNISLREKDWVEHDEMVDFINEFSLHNELDQIRTEPLMQHLSGFIWPSTDELCQWYKTRARDIDTCSGQLDNCLSLLDFACRKGIRELKPFHEDISYLYQIIYCRGSDYEIDHTLSLVAWEQLSDYEKFKMMLNGVKEKLVIAAIYETAIPFMLEKSPVSKEREGTYRDTVDHGIESYLVRWLKELAAENNLDICLMVIEEGCKEFKSTGIFKDEAEAVYCALECIYLTSVLDRWSTMAAILSKVPALQSSELHLEALRKRLKLTEGHIEAGRLLALYQVPKPVGFFLRATSDEKTVKQILRLMLSKFIRRQPGRSDNDWANMWRDMQCLHEKAFPFLDLEYILVEFCRGLLKAGKFSLARSYLKGAGSVNLAPEKAENLVIQAAREYFYSASSLACSEIWKAKECLNILPSSKSVKAEADVIDAVTVKLPDLGVTLLPLQFRQIKDPMEVIKMAITNQSGAYLHVDELIKIAKLLGLTSPDDVSAVEEAIAREAAVAGDLQLAFDLCLVLVKKGHGLIWDLCAAIARGPALENMDISSRKKLLGFSLSHCDDESMGELLHAWKELDIQGQCEKLMILTGTHPPNFSVQGSSVLSLPVHSVEDVVNLRGCMETIEGVVTEDHDAHISSIKELMHLVAKKLPIGYGSSWESILKENGKLLSFAGLQLPWLIELTKRSNHGKYLIWGTILGKQCVNVRMQAALCILSWIARTGFSPKDEVIVSLVKSVVEPPVNEEEDILGCSFMLNLLDAFHGVEIIEDQLRRREDYQETSRIMNVGMIYSFLSNSQAECDGPGLRRELLLKKFREKYSPLDSDEINKIEKSHSMFWSEWKFKLEEQKRISDRSRMLEQILPGAEISRFLSGDVDYIRMTVFSLIDSVVFEKKYILKDVLKVANAYDLSRTEVLLRYLSSVLLSEVWSNEDISAEISDFKSEIIAAAAESINTISMVVYPEIEGRNKHRLAYIYALLSECYLTLEMTKESKAIQCSELPQVSAINLVNFYKLVEQECTRVSFIKNLNFKNIAGLDGINFKCFNDEVYDHIDGTSLESLAEMVDTLVSSYDGPLSENLVSSGDVYKHYILSLLENFETEGQKMGIKMENFQTLLIKLEQAYSLSMNYARHIGRLDALDIMKRYFTVIIPQRGFSESILVNSRWQNGLVMLINFWIRLADDMHDIATDVGTYAQLKFNPKYLTKFLTGFMRLVVEEVVSPVQGWTTVTSYANSCFAGNGASEGFVFCRAMIFSGCGFNAVAEVVLEALAEFSVSSTSNLDMERDAHIESLPHLYLKILEPILNNLVVGGSHESQNLNKLLSSLSKFEGESEELKRVRHAVWERMTKFSDNLELSSDVRVYALELMQRIAGGHYKSNSAEQQCEVLPWEEWDEFPCTSNSLVTPSDGPKQMDTSSRFTNTLVALKSSQLAASIYPNIEITVKELQNSETAASCYSKLCEAASTGPHFDALLAILEEWEGLFVSGKDVQASAVVGSNEANDWDNDDWDEGWETFQDGSPEEERKVDPLSLHPLHACWKEILKKLVILSRFLDALKLIDRYLAKPCGILLDEDGANEISKIVLEVDCFVALKMMLLLPYEAVWLRCFGAVEDKLKQAGIPEAAGKDLNFLVLALSSGTVSTIMSTSTYGTTFSYLCYLVGNLSRQLQEAELLKSKDRDRNEREMNVKGDDALLFFRAVLFPSFIAELVKADQHILAGFLVTKFMHANASLSLINVAEASLRKYLSMHLEKFQDQGFPSSSSEVLVNSVYQLKSRFRSLVQSALTLLPSSK